MQQYSNALHHRFRRRGVPGLLDRRLELRRSPCRERQDRNKELDRQKKVLVVAGLIEKGRRRLRRGRASFSRAASSPRSSISRAASYDVDADAADL